MAQSEFAERIRKLSPAKLLLVAEQLQARVAALDQARREAVAIIGIGCRLPGGADTPDGFWQLLCEGRDAIREVPHDRWDADALFDVDPDAPGRMSTRWGGFLDAVDQFDPRFFGIAPREAISLDPQQRLLLEVTWEALEHAGVPADSLAGSSTGVFVGISGSDYFQLQMARGLETIDTYLASGTAHSVASGRLAYVLGAQGPTFSVDTACSSSLVAVHSAVQSLRAGECRMALAGGVNLILSPITTIALSKARMMAPDGRCKAFDARADGFVRSEGAGILVLKRLSQAVADGDPIVAVIRGSAINQDGRSNGLTAPNGPAQEAVIRAALENAGVSPLDVGYVEAHGTGTSLGDPIEVQALGATLGVGRDRHQPLLLGSVKTNIGHLESAAGVAGLIKAALVLRHGQVPPHLHLTTPNPLIPWDSLPVAIPTALTPWGEAGARIAGVSSFGFSGTNAHIVLAESPAAVTRPADGNTRPVHVIALSARSAPALRALAGRVADDLAQSDTPLPDVCHTMSAGRSQFTHRLAFVVGSTPEARNGLTAFANGEAADRVSSGQLEAPRPPGVVFLFTGQGSQYVGMGRTLYDTQPIFRDALDRCAALLAPALDRPLLSVMFGETPDAAALLAQTGYTQPALFALEYALATLWGSWGIRPSAVMGHSVGEYAAACAAGACALEDGLRLIAARGRLMQALPAGGAMGAVFAGPDRVATAITSNLAIAAINGPDHVVISGPESELNRLLGAFDAQGVRTQRLEVSHAFHSPLMDPMLDEFARAAAGVTFAPPDLSMVSNLTGALVGRQDLASPAYWRDHVRRPVQFARGMQTLRDQGYELFVEIGPHPVLLGMGGRCVDGDAIQWLPSLRRGRDDWQEMLTSLSALYTRGVTVDWQAFDRPYGYRRASLARYPFQRSRYWIEGSVRPSAPIDAADATEARSQASPVPAPDDAVGQMMLEVRWPSSDLRRVDAARACSHLAGVPEIARETTSHVAALYAEHDLATFETALPRIDALCAAYIAQALRRMGWTFSPNQRITVDLVISRCGILARHRRLLQRCLAILEEDGFLQPAADGWLLRIVPPVVDTASVARALHEQYPAYHGELRLTTRCGEQLAEALRGDADPLQLLFPGGSMADAENLYQKSPVARAYNGLVLHALQAALTTLPATSALRILEIGAGTGGTTSALLPILPAGRTEYWFTDTSRVFASSAREKFRGYPFLRFANLDIGRDPATQGVPLGSFDIIVAANVLHSTPDLRQTLAHVRSLLAPGGVLLLLEASSPERYADLTVGLTEGWWAFADTDLRPGYALMPQARWLALLPECGFGDAAAVPGEDAVGVLARQAVVVARAANDDVAAPPAQRRWIVLAADATAESVGEMLSARGDHVTMVREGAAFARHEDGSFAINVADPDDYRRLMEQAAAAAMPGAAGVICMWPIAADMPATMTPEHLEASQRLSTLGVMRLAQALVGRSGGPLPLWIVTRGAQATGHGDGERAALAQAPVWGLAHTIALEHPELRCTRVDLDPSGLPLDAAAHILAELSANDGEDQVAYRQSSRRVRRLAWSEIGRAAAPVGFHPHATYLITGGLRGLGPVVARWMADRGARHLALVGRRGPDDDTQRLIQDLASQGAQAHVMLADVADREQIAGVLARIDEALPPLHGIIHSAGVVDDAIFMQQTWAHLASVMSAKVRGSWHLQELTQHRALDFVALFSTGVSLIGSGGQANHAAANAFVDMLAPWWRARGVPAVAINWGAWADVGAAVGRRLSTDRQGVKRMSPTDGLEAFERILHAISADRDGAPTQVAVLAADWSAFLDQFAAEGPPLFREIARHVRRRESRGEPSVQVPTLTFAAELASASPARRNRMVRLHVREQVAKVLGVPDPASIEFGQPLRDLGLDSLMAVQLRNALATSLARSLPATLLFEYPTVKALAAYLSGAASPAMSDAQPDPVEPEPSKAVAEDATEDDLAAALAARLDRIERRFS